MSDLLSNVTVTVVTPVYNRENYVGETIASILAQTFEDFELIIVDDGSTDASVERIEAFDDPRIRLIRQKNSGCPACPRNVAISLARGRYVAFLDSDDLWVPTKLARQVELLEERPDIDLVYGFAERFDEHGEAGGRIGPKSACVPERIFESLLFQGCFVLIGTVMVRRDALLHAGAFDERPELRAVEDFDLWLRIARVGGCLFEAVVWTWYRHHQTNISANRLDMLRRTRAVVERHLAAANAGADLERRALGYLAWEDFKAQIEHGGDRRSARLALTEAMRKIGRTPRLVLGLAVTFAPVFQVAGFAYRRRKVLTQLRDWLNDWRRSGKGCAALQS